MVFFSARKNLSLSGSIEEDVPRMTENLETLCSSTFQSSLSSHLPKAAQTSLCELSELLEEGEKKGMFRQHMPPRILATITHHNLTFLRDRDIFTEDYFEFIFAICTTALVSFTFSSSCLVLKPFDLSYRSCLVFFFFGYT